MKLKLVLLASLVPALAMANAVYVRFRSDSPLPAKMQSVVADAVTKRCSFESSSDVFEVNTTARFERVDQNYGDWHYATVFQVMAMDSDGYHPRNYTITAESIDAHFSNPAGGDSQQVERLVGWGCK